MPFHYLGIPLSGVYLKVADYGPLLDKVAKTLLVWSDLNLSYAGKLEVISSVVQGIEAFYKEQGSLGLRDTKRWHEAFLARTLWNIHLKKDTLALYGLSFPRGTSSHYSSACSLSVTSLLSPMAQQMQPYTGFPPGMLEAVSTPPWLMIL
ncbi:hypothetical protein M9H77_03505 [Catharanthus roseus]|uniref:Uncharacterized protein n=1 Tax=Catharanthus roseus TaxID=4058 RepID=A0ACC0CBL9_CATRO|nr:hypothetical protein M9H77_03505 [Catharanthus roseus]